MKNDESRKRVPVRVTVWLTCGCAIKRKDRPINYHATYPCQSGLGHGYQLRWTRWEDGDRRGYNPRL